MSTSPSASARAAKPARPAQQGRTRVHLAVADPALAGRLAAELGRRPELAAVPLEAAAVIVADGEHGDFGRTPMVSIGGDGPNALQTRDPALILSAAALVGAGYLLSPAAPLAEPHAAPRVRLSQREQQVAALLVDGASNKLIARALEISVHTAKFHVTGVLDKVGARNRADAVAIVLREGLIAL
ncbi:MAG TPA: LuxR C-terminal-related transcriptional regulator [Devosia sp.]|nr:LuxR C-terminal-related transcriptional regulator [Devosia sp.]